MKEILIHLRRLFLPILFFVSLDTAMVFAQTPFVTPVIVTQTGTSTSYSSVVAAPESVNGTCTEIGQTWTHNFAGTTDRRLSGFTIAATSYFVNNFGSLNTVMMRNNSSGGTPPTPTCPVTTPPWNDRQIVFFEGTRNATTNIASIVNSFPTTTLPGTAGYNSINDMNLVFSRGFINAGADNIFNNLEGSQAGYNSNSNNIERMDLFVSGGVNVTAANMTRTGIVIVCRGPADDPIVLSAIKGLSGGGNIGGGTTYIYDDIIKINATWTSKTINGGGAIAIGAPQRVTLIAGVTSVVLRRMDSEATLNGQLLSADYPTISSFVPTSGTQPITGMFFTFADLGLTAGETFYGYSLSGFDVTAVNSNQFNSYTNTTYFPLLTNPADGGVDLTGFPGLFAPVDIDDDDDGLPDYLEANLSLAFGDHDTDGVPNWSDVNYPGYVDNNGDLVNDNFDPSADSDNDATPNYRDNSFAGYVDSNSDTVNDNFDWDLDGIPNHLDRDCDNDGVPDVVESFGVDTNGDGVIDNYTDTDVDGLSQNVDASSTGAVGSGTGLGAIDTDGDGVPNYMDLDSDNDGIPDVVEAYATDSNNNGIIDGYADTDSDGYSDNVDGDVGNDLSAENSANSLLLTGSDGNNDGRADSYPNKNMDADSKPNPYDMDSDMDGILDVIEAGFADANFNGIIDGTFNSKGWSTTVAAMGSLNLPNTDANGRVNVYDIDSDNDGIPDNVEGLPTLGYLLPANADADGDGLDNSYDNVSGFGGNGINPVDTDSDTIPDYLDSDTDGDGQNDIKEGNDFNLNGIADDPYGLSGVDTDGDGLDNTFDVNNSSAEGTSAYMGNGGTFTGDGSPGSNTMVQQTPVGATDRDWRYILFLLDCDITIFKALLQDKNKTVLLDWSVYCRQRIDHFEIERSLDGVFFTYIKSVIAEPILREVIAFNTTDDISQMSVKVIYYRLKAKGETGRLKYSNVVSVKTNSGLIKDIQVAPNPVKERLQLGIKTEKPMNVEISITDVNGRVMFRSMQSLLAGINNITYNDVNNWHKGIYMLMVNTGDAILTRKFIILN